MTKKRKRLEDELKKLIAKKAEVEARITETQDQIQEETNIEIHEMVHAAHLTPEQLADVLAVFRKGNIHSAVIIYYVFLFTINKPVSNIRNKIKNLGNCILILDIN